MSQRVHSNVGYIPNRRLPQIFGDSTQDAVTNAGPNTLNSNKPNIADAMGVSGRSGVVSFIHDFTASTPDLTLWFWCDALNRKDPAQGWIYANEATAGHTKAVPAYSLATFNIPEGTPFFIQSSVAEIRNLWTAGATKHPSNPNADLAFNAADDT